MFTGASIGHMNSSTLQVSADQLVEQFVTSARNAAATAEVIDRTPEALRDAILQKAGAVERILFSPPQLLPLPLFSAFAADPRVVTEPDSETLVHSPVGVTEAFAGIARTGSVCVDVSYQRTGMVSLLAPLHIAVVAAESIVPRPRDLFRSDVAEGQGLKRDFVFITGPSATADMGPLVRGVHGPHRLHIIVLR